MGMFAIGSGFVLIVGLIAIVIGLRGKISERGVYCKSCRFDLQGTRIDDPDAQCPECGSRVHHRDAQWDVLRRVSRVWVISGCVIALFAMGGLYISLFSSQASVFSYLPNEVVLSFAEKGYTDAVDEAIDRWMNVGDLSLDQQDQLIQHALDVQADQSLVWDTRWGELLRNAIEMKMLSNEQLIAFALNGYTYRVALPEMIRQGEDEIAWTLITDADRVMSTWGGVMPYKLGVWITSWGVEGQSSIAEFEFPRYVRPLILQGPEPNQDSVRSRFRGARQFTDAPTGSEIEIFVEYRVRLLDPDQTEPILDRAFRQRHTLKIVGDTDEIVTGNQGTRVAEQVLESLSLTPIYIAADMSLAENQHQLVLAQATLNGTELPIPISMRVTIRIDDEEIELDQFSVKTQRGVGFGELLTWRIMPSVQSGIDAAKPMHDMLLNAAQVDVLMRPDPEFARENPEIKEIADVVLIFRDVPVLIQHEENWYNQSRLDQATVKGAIIIEP